MLRTFYASDTGALPETARAGAGTGPRSLDAFWGHNWSRALHSVQETIERAGPLGPGTIYLTHLAPCTDTPIHASELGSAP